MIDALILTIADCLSDAKSWQEFTDRMAQKGYETELGKDNSRIIWTDMQKKQAGKRFYRIDNKSLQKHSPIPMNLEKESLERRFAKNAQKCCRDEHRNNLNKYDFNGAGYRYP